MSAYSSVSETLRYTLRDLGYEDSAFDAKGQAFVTCPKCHIPRALKLSLLTERVQCRECDLSGGLWSYLQQYADCKENLPEALEPSAYEEGQVIQLSFTDSSSTALTRPRRGRTPQGSVQTVAAEPVVIEARPVRPNPNTKTQESSGEVWIISFLSLVFFCAGTAAAILSGFANFQAFSQTVSDPFQAQIWGWSGVIASVVAFGGFTFFWWHLSAKRWGEAIRSVIFALAGAATSIAGTTLYMVQNQDIQADAETKRAQTLELNRAELQDLQRQLAAIPPETRSVSGLQDYLRSVEQVGRTHHKAYRDAQNELGQAQRRASLEQRTTELRDQLRQAATAPDTPLTQRGLPAWLFALMLEVFSSQGTSIACVSLLLLFEGRRRASQT